MGGRDGFEWYQADAAVEPKRDRAEVWLVHRFAMVLVQPAGLGVPAGAIQSTDGTIGGTYFDKRDCCGEMGWEEGEAFAARRAGELGYSCVVFNPFEGDGQPRVVLPQG